MKTTQTHRLTYFHYFGIFIMKSDTQYLTLVLIIKIMFTSHVFNTIVRASSIRLAFTFKNIEHIRLNLLLD